MDFTATYRHTARDCVAFSPGSTFIAYVGGAKGTRVFVRVFGTLQVVRSWELSHTLNALSWSRDGLFLLVSAHADGKDTGVSFVLPLDPDASVRDGSDDGRGWVAKLDAGPAGLHSAAWLPVWRIPAVVQFSHFGIRALISSLVDQALFVVPHTQPMLLACAAWPEHYGLVQREHETDYIALYRAKDGKAPNMDDPVEWIRDRVIRLHTRHLSNIEWSPDGNYFCVCEHHLEYKAYIHSLSGALLATFQQVNGTPETFVAPGALGSRSSSLRASQTPVASVAGGGLGIRKVAWHPSSQFIAIGGYDEAVRILASGDWTEAYTLDLSERTVQSNVWSEPRHWFEATEGCGIVALEQIVGPVELRAAAGERNDIPQAGICELAWNNSGSFLAVINEAIPSTVFVYEFAFGEGVHVAGVLSLSAPVCSLAWSPKSDTLAVGCGNSAVYLWNEDAPEAVAVPNYGFSTQRVEWIPDGRALLLVSTSAFCCAVSAEHGIPS